MRAISRFGTLALFTLVATLAVTPAPVPTEAPALPAAPQASPALPNPRPMPGCVMHTDEWGRCTGITCPDGDYQCYP